MRTLGTGGSEISVVGYGGWQAGGTQWGPPVDDDQVIAAIRAALDSGQTWVDTAEVYGSGRSEELVGRAVAGRRHPRRGDVGCHGGPRRARAHPLDRGLELRPRSRRALPSDLPGEVGAERALAHLPRRHGRVSALVGRAGHRLPVLLAPGLGAPHGRVRRERRLPGRRLAPGRVPAR